MSAWLTFETFTKQTDRLTGNTTSHMQLNFCLFRFSHVYILPFCSLLIVELLKTSFASALTTFNVTFSIILHYSIVTSYLYSLVCNLAFLEAALRFSQSYEDIICSVATLIFKKCVPKLFCFRLLLTDVFRNNYLILKEA